MKKNVFKFMASAVVLTVLAACGGGGGGGSETSNPSTPAATTPITGTAAVGAAISGAAVTAKCVMGNASTTTAADGSYSLPTTDLTTPCMLEVTFGSPTQKLHSIATKAGRTNITPITELATALAFSNSALTSLYGTVTGEQLKQAAAALPGASQQALTALTAESLTLPAGFDPISGPLSPPAAGQAIGDVHDQLLDRLKLKLDSRGQTLQSWVSRTVAPTPTPTPTVAATCSTSNLTTTAFDAIQLGMTLTQVNQIIGCAYSPDSTQRMIDSVAYAWIPPNSIAMIVVWFDASGTTVTSIPGSVKPLFKSGSGF